MIIDGHAHACGEFLTSEGIIQILDKQGIDKVILVPGELNSKAGYLLPDLAGFFPGYNVVKITNFLTKIAIKLTGKVKEIPAGNEYVHDLTQKAGGRIIQFIWITTQVKDPSQFLDHKYAAWNFQGVKLHQCWESFSVDSDFFREVALWTENHNLPLFIHLCSDREVRKIIQYKKDHRNLKLIVAHLFGLELFIKENLRDENLYFDASPPQLISTRRLIQAINFAGINRITFGSDTPYGKGNIQKNLNRIRNLNITPEEKAFILGGNIKKIIHLQYIQTI